MSILKIELFCIKYISDPMRGKLILCFYFAGRIGLIKIQNWWSNQGEYETSGGVKSNRCERSFRRERRCAGNLLQRIF